MSIEPWARAARGTFTTSCSGIDVYDSSGMVALPFTPEMLVSG